MIASTPFTIEFVPGAVGLPKNEYFDVSAIMADLDHFKNVNDTYGHMAGDAVLRLTARRMLSQLRDYDYIGRYGGEEFMIVLPGCDSEQARILAERLCQSIGGKSMDIPDGMIPVTISLGVVTTCKGNKYDAGTLVQAADLALYRAKENGRNRVETAEGLN